MNRRDLFDPRQVARLAGQVLQAVCDEPDLPQDLALVRCGWRAMATNWQILLPLEHADIELARAAFELLDELEDQLSVYRDYSEVSLLNRAAVWGPVRVESRLFTLLQLARSIWEQTNGAFDLAIGRLIRAWGFFKGPRRVPTLEELRQLLEQSGMRFVQLNASVQTVQFAASLVEINLGAIGKGYALDRMVELCEKIPAALLHGGSSSVYAKGAPSKRQRGWRVRIRHPWNQRRYLAEVWLNDRALGTSAASFQYLEYEGKKLGHILDPRSGWPTSEMASVSVIASSATLADALSTAFFVGGMSLIEEYCSRHPEIGVVALRTGERTPTILNLSPDDYTF